MQEHAAQNGLNSGLTLNQPAILAITLAVLVLFTMAGGPWGVDPDAFMFAQYGRAAAEGHPFRYTPHSEPSTGSTSLLYPFLLICPRVSIGQTPLVLWWIWLIDAACFLSLVLGAQKLAPLAGANHMLATVLVATSGPLIYNSLGGTDMPLFAACFLWLLIALARGRTIASAVLAALGVLIRPEGAVTGIVLGACSAFPFRRPANRAGCAAVAGTIVSLPVVFGINFILTGSWQFQSLMGKGYFASFPVSGAAIRTLNDIALIVRELLFGLGPDRSTYALSVANGLLLLAGSYYLLYQARPARSIALAVILSSIFALVLNAAGGWQGHQFDRHLMWLFPPCLVLVAAGVKLLCRAPKLLSIRKTGAVILVAYQLCMLPRFAAERYDLARVNRAQADFTTAVDRTLEADAPVGILNFPGLALFTVQRNFQHLGGYISPRYAAIHPALLSLEVIKHEPEMRFPYWLLSRLDRESEAVRGLLGPPILQQSLLAVGPATLSVYAADWDPLLRGVEPVDSVVREKINGLELVDCLDVGYDADEQSHHYRVSSLGRARVSPVKIETRTGGFAVQDIGRVVNGWEEFRVWCDPSRPLIAVARVAGGRVRLLVHGPDGLARTLWFDPRDSSPVRVKIGGSTAAEFIPDSGKGFSERVIVIEKKSLYEAPVTLRSEGNYISFCWWFYQIPASGRPLTGQRLPGRR